MRGFLLSARTGLGRLDDHLRLAGHGLHPGAAGGEVERELLTGGLGQRLELEVLCRPPIRGQLANGLALIGRLKRPPGPRDAISTSFAGRKPTFRTLASNLAFSPTSIFLFPGSTPSAKSAAAW